ncbi:hypothetical protein GGI23_002902 [Coemansia sp. RSA 2559]|nr:hypothetical protein GGI23_002902 [Coemansia sp. RSA 2559]
MEDKTGEGGNRRFSLLSALNGLFERARSSAEKESQRLFTSPLASTASTTASVGEPGDPSYGSPRKRSNTRPLLADSVARTKMRPRPARTAPDTRALYARRPSEAEPRPASVVSDRTKLATTVDLMSIVAPSERSDDVISTGVLSTPGSHMKRKHSVLHSTSSSPVSAVPSTAAVRSMRTDSSHGAVSPKRARSAESTHTVDSPALDGALHMPPALVSGSGESTATAHSVTPQEIHNSQPPETRASLGTKRKVVGFEDDKGPAVVERSRLEKVERELRQLKRIIASLVPGELNDDDLRSVYGELDIGRQSSEDVLSRLMRIRAGAASSHADTMHSAMPKPLRGAVPPPPPPPLPSPPFSALARDSKAAASAAAAARAQLSLPPPPHFSGATSRKKTPVSSPESAQPAEQPPRPSAATVQRLRADLRPVSSPMPSAAKPTLPPPPHKDPNVMSQMLQEMKTHKLRSVKKPKDMEAVLPKRQRH